MSRRLRLPAQCGGDSSVASDATATRNYATVTEDAAPTESAARRADDVLTVNLAVVCNGFLLCTIYYFANIIIDDLRDHGSITIDLSILRPTTLTLFFALWFMCNASLIVGNLGFRCWRSGRTTILNLQLLAVCWDWSWSAAAVLLHVAMVVVPVLVCHQRGLHGVITFALTVEQMRLLMKSIDYLCEHVRSALMAKPTNDSITHLLLFMNAPTFIYKDNYKRTRCVRLLPALGHACVLVLSSITMVTMVERSLRGVSLLLASYWITTIRMAPVGLVLLMGSAIVLYSASAMSAELLRFPTDGIVQAWWNVSSFGAFLGNWNLIVKAWLSKYAFKPMLRRGYSVTASKLATILLSAIGHEFVLVGTLGFVIPYVAFLYVFGTAFLIWDPLGVQLKKRGNFATLLLISLGVGMVITFYATENVARKRCPSTTNQYLDIFVPRSFTCDKLHRATQLDTGDERL